ncbi:HAD-IIA family hydrolase [Halorussus salilacus]|uniref:HAD-IIA family hydrolase n=1 Tax=Halorussus salilacus TaxID=2953750 RepID=UPI00209CB593|nr:HAD-IIA family hydrolase [Halorussus salilacus]USZ67818.1 HAD-IIA family hydrolase [Halorussus salilacus]
MKGVVLAAGIGSRLRPLTLHEPKSCISVDGRPVLEHQLHAYADAGVTDVTVVAGYLADRTRALCESVTAERPDLDVTVVESDVYANTDNMYSLYLAREAVSGEQFVLSNGDVVFEPELLADLLDSDADSAVACDRGNYSEESMKVTADDRGLVSHISKDVPENVAHGVSTDVYRFSAEFSEMLFDEITRTVEREGDYGDWTEAAIDRLVRSREHDVEPADVSGREWVEIDDFDDLRAADVRFSSLSDLGSKEAAFFDLDGTMYLDDDLVDGASELVERLSERGVDVYFLSNNSSGWKDDYAEKLDSLGVPVEQERVLLSTDGVIDHLRRSDAGRVYVLGTEAMREALAGHGVEVVDPGDSGDSGDSSDSGDSGDADAVVVGFDTELTYEKAREATLAIRDGATFLLAHPDDVCPTAEGFVPDCGSIGAMIERATDRHPSRVFGKPNPEMVSHVLDAEGYDPADVVVVGDRLETDVRLADNVGCESVCVLTGDADRLDAERSDLAPTLVAPSVGTLTRFIAGDPVADERAQTAESGTREATSEPSDGELATETDGGSATLPPRAEDDES